MRLSVNPFDPDFIGLDNFGRYKVLLNGAEVQRCTEADEEHGTVEFFVVDEDGKYIIEGDDIKRGSATGFVKIVDTRS